MATIPSPYSGSGSSLATPVSVPNGGTGDASVAAYSVVVGGTTSTNGLQTVSGLGSSKFSLRSAGAAAIPTWGIDAPAIAALTDAAPTTIDASTGNVFTWLLTSAVGGSRTLSPPTNPVAGQSIVLEIQQPASGGPCTVTFSSAAGGYEFGTSGAPTLTVTASNVDLLGFRYNSALGKWLYQGSQLGYS